MKKVTLAAVGLLATIPLMGYAETTPDATTTVSYKKNTNYKSVVAAEPAKATSIGELTGNFDITTNYIFRGISQSNNLPAFQGGLTYTFKRFGIYGNIWGSNVSWPESTRDGTNTGNATVEVDYVVGVTNDIGEHFNYNINLSRYSYPKAGRLNYNELNLIATYYFLTGKIGYSPNVYNVHESGTYYSLGVDFDVPCKYTFNISDVSVGAWVGRYNLPTDAGKSYDDYSALINKKISNYTLTLQWTDTNHANNNGTLDDSKIIFTVLVDF